MKNQIAEIFIRSAWVKYLKKHSLILQGTLNGMIHASSFKSDGEIAIRKHSTFFPNLSVIINFSWEKSFLYVAIASLPNF